MEKKGTFRGITIILVIISTISLAYVSAQDVSIEGGDSVEGVINLVPPGVPVTVGNGTFNQTLTDGLYVKKVGDTMTGQLVIQAGNGRIVSTNAGGGLRIDTAGGAGAGYLSFGNTADIGISTDGVEGTWDSDGTLIFKQKASNPDSVIEYLFIEETGSFRLALPSSGADLATGNPRSMIIGYGASNNESDVYCSYNGFDKIDCNTGLTGGDLGVTDAIQVGKALWSPQINSTNITSSDGIFTNNLTLGGNEVCTGSNGICPGINVSGNITGTGDFREITYWSDDGNTILGADTFLFDPDSIEVIIGDEDEDAANPNARLLVYSNSTNVLDGNNDNLVRFEASYDQASAAQRLTEFVLNLPEDDGATAPGVNIVFDMKIADADSDNAFNRVFTVLEQTITADGWTFPINATNKYYDATVINLPQINSFTGRTNEQRAVGLEIAYGGGLHANAVGDQTIKGIQIINTAGTVFSATASNLFYNLYIDSGAKPTVSACGNCTHYSIWNAPTLDNYFGGALGIKDSTPSYELDVNGEGWFVGDLHMASDLEHRGSQVGFYNTTPVNQISDCGFMDTTNLGNASVGNYNLDQIDDVGTTIDVTDTEDNFADLAEAYNCMRDALRTLGLMA